MRTLILDAMENENFIVNGLKRILEEKKGETTDFKLKDVHVAPCRGCSACSFRSPGKCVFNDDIHPILKTWVESRLIVMVTPVRFGGYSPHLKKVIDKSATLALPFYGARGGKMYHLPRYDRKSLLAIGLVSEELPGEAENFRKLAAGNAWNMQYDCQTLIVGPTDPIEKITREIQNVIEEVVA